MLKEYLPISVLRPAFMLEIYPKVQMKMIYTELFLVTELFLLYKWKLKKKQLQDALVSLISLQMTKQLKPFSRWVVDLYRTTQASKLSK
jgi:hypothetical protein